MSRISVSIVGAMLLVSLLAAPSGALEPAPVAQTENGEVASILNDGVLEWRAIPYAAPPVGDLRWRPPAEPAAWSGVRLEADFAPQCLQLGLEAPV